MLYLHPPYYQYEGVTVLGDSHDPRQYYYFPNRPHLAVDDQNRPAIRFLAFKANLDEVGETDEHVTGFLVFDTSLSWSEETLNKVARKIQDDQKLDELPRLAPLLYKSGSVRLMFLDRATPAPGEEEEPPETDPDQPPEKQRWVTFLETSGVPSLYGENRAIFSAELTKEATALLFKAFEGVVPAGVVYDLTFVGMQRAFNIHVEADWEQIYHRLQEQFSVNVVFYSIDIGSVLDDLIDRKLIKFEASLEGVGDEGMESEFNQVRKQIQEMILEKFFKPVVNPFRPDRNDTVDGILDLAEGLHDLRPNIGYSRLELNASEIRSIDIDYTVSKAVERQICPQAHLSLFFEDYNLTREQVVTVVNGKDELWEEVDFEVLLNANFQREGISAVSVDISYGLPLSDGSGNFPVSWSMLLNANNPQAKRKAWYDPAVGQKIRYRYTVHFAPESVPGAKTALSSGWLENDTPRLMITPANLYELRQVEAVLVKNFPFDRYPQVFVHLRYQDATGWKYEDSALLDQDKPRLPFTFRTAKDAPAAVDYRFTFLRSNGETLESSWQSTGNDLILVQDPAPDLLTVRVLVGGDRSKIANLIVDFKYEDAANHVHESGSIILDSLNLNKINEWRVPLADPQQRRYWYSQTLIDTDGNMTRTGWINDDKTTLTVGMVYAKMMEVQPELVGRSLTSQGIEMIKLNLRYDDTENQYHTETQMQFSQPGKGEVWRVPLKNAGDRDYQYDVTYVMRTGFERKLGPLTSRDTFLVIPSTPPR